MLDRHQFAIELVTETFFFCHWTKLQGTKDTRACNLSYKLTHKDFFEKLRIFELLLCYDFKENCVFFR